MTGRHKLYSLVAVLLLLVSCSDSRSVSTHLIDVRIAVGGQNLLVYLPTSLARELGFYADEGLNVDLQDFPGRSKALQALIGGSAEVVSGFYDHTIQMATEGRDIVGFVTMLRFPGAHFAAERQQGHED